MALSDRLQDVVVRVARGVEASRVLTRGFAPRLPHDLPAHQLGTEAPSGAVVAAIGTETLAELRSALANGARAVVVGAPGRTAQELAGLLEPAGLEHGAVDATPDGAIARLFSDAATATRVLALDQATQTRPRALAIMPVFNEEDVIGPAIADLIGQGVDVYLIDHCSTDGTVAAAEPYLGRGLVHIERFPDDAGFDEQNRHEMVWREILRRVEQVSEAERDYSWYLFVNADEFRETPWPDTTLRDGLARVDELGYNAVNFALFNFRPTDESFVPGTDPRVALTGYEVGALYDTLQIKAWRRPTGGTADLVHSGGHNIGLPGRRVFPLPFILRHYPIRSSEHGRRKVHAERLGRFSRRERADGWHVQYDAFADTERSFLHDSATLRQWNGDAIRASLLADALDHVLLIAATRGIELGAELDMQVLDGWLERRGDAPGAAAPAHAMLTTVLRGGDVQATPELGSAVAEVARVTAARASLAGDPLLARRLREVHGALAAGLDRV